MRIVFAGTPEFARVALEALRVAGHEIVLVMTQPDRPAGRGMKLTPSPVKQAALDAGIPVAQPRSLKLDGRWPEDAQAAQAELERLQPDIMVVAAYGLILPAWTLALPRLGCLNIHASLLPRWRGAAPIQRAIEAGDAETGVTIMQMDEGLDTGDMLLEKRTPIGPAQTAAELHDVLALLGGEAIVEALARHGELIARPQPEAGVTYAAKLDKAEAALDLSLPAEILARRIRAFNPVPGATLFLSGLEQPVKVWQARVLTRADAVVMQAHAVVEPGRLELVTQFILGDSRLTGQVLAVSPQGIDIGTGDGVLRILELQKAGGKRQPVAAFIQGWQRP